MKKVIVAAGLLAAITLGAFYIKGKFYDPKHRIQRAKNEVKQLDSKGQLKNGDLIFQTSLSGQSKAIQLATNSKYSHCGLIFKRKGTPAKWYVLEAVQPVKYTPLDKWIARGEKGKYVIKRVVTDPMLPAPMLERVREIGEGFIGKKYDLAFEWSDEKIYCSELIWKAYKRATGLEIGELEKLKDFDLTNAVVQQKMKERYGNKLPVNEPVISPASVFNSERLITIESN